MTEHQTNFWEKDTEWNGVIFPLHMEDIASFKREYTSQDICIKPIDANSSDLTEDIRCDIEVSVLKCKTAQQTVIEIIDKIRKVDVPWKIYLIIWVVMLLIIFGLVYVLLGVVKMAVKFSIPIAVGLVVFSTLAMALITYCGFKEEEIEDAKKLAELYNKVKDERIH